MRSIFGIAVAVIAVAILAYNPHIVTGPINKLIQSVTTYNPDTGKSKGFEAVDIPRLKFPGRKDRDEYPAAQTIRNPKPEQPKAKRPVDYGARAVAVQKARGL